MNKEQAICNVCGEPMPPGEEMFRYHGYSGDCPKPPLKPSSPNLQTILDEFDEKFVPSLELIPGNDMVHTQIKDKYKSFITKVYTHIIKLKKCWNEHKEEPKP